MSLTDIVLQADGDARYRQIARQLEGKILSGELIPGSRLPAERALARRFSVAVCTINCAMKELEKRGLVVRRVGAGTFVSGSAGTDRLPFTPKVAFVCEFPFSLRDEYLLAMMDNLNTFFSARQYDLLFLTRKPPEYERCFEEYHLQGMILYSPRREAIPAIRQLCNKGYPVVALSTFFPEIADVSCGYSNAAVMRDAVRYLRSLGHRRIGYLNPRKSFNHHQRFRGYWDAMHEAGLEIPDHWIQDRDPDELKTDIHHGAGMLSRLLDAAPELTAVMAANDNFALGALHAAQERGIRIPDDLSIVGFDDYSFSAFLNPPLTTVLHPAEEAGRLAALAIDRFLKGLPKYTAIVCCNYMIYRLVRQVLEMQGKRVPEDCSLVCFDYSGKDWEEERITCSIHQGRKIGALVAQGIIFDNQEYSSPVSYLFTGLNQIKPKMLEMATQNAKQAAEQFALSSQSKVGKIKNANQGVFSILPREQIPGVSETEQINKTVRVVSTVVYYLE